MIHGKLLELLNDLRKQPASREMAIALTKMEEVIHRVTDKLELDSSKAMKEGSDNG